MVIKIAPRRCSSKVQAPPPCPMWQSTQLPQPPAAAAPCSSLHRSAQASSVFTNCTASLAGGAVASTSAFSCTDCSFVGNSAPLSGGAISVSGNSCPHRPLCRSLGRYVNVGTNVAMLALAAVRIEREAAMECLCSFVWEDVARTQSPSRSLQLAKTVLVPGAATVLLLAATHIDSTKSTL